MDEPIDPRAAVEKALQSTAVIDMHTHLFPPAFYKLYLAGIDELLTYHYLVAEALRLFPGETREYWRKPKTAQAEWIWRVLFLERTPASEASRGVLTVLRKLGLDVHSADLSTYREYFREVSPDGHVNKVLDLAGISRLVMTNDPFDPVERGYWLEGILVDPRFLPALRLDALLNDWPWACNELKTMNFAVESDFSGRTISEIRRFLGEWDDRICPLYLAVSLPPDFTYPESSSRGRILEEAVLPLCRERRRTLALMIGVKRGVNPEIGLAGDASGIAEIESLERLCGTNPEIRFLVTMLARENQHGLAVAARKFGNLMPFGCWWFLNIPSMIREITAIRLELLGLDFIPQHSDARVLEQLIYKWNHSRETIASVLAEYYGKLVKTGWSLTEETVKRDMERLFVGNFNGIIHQSSGSKGSQL